MSNIQEEKDKKLKQQVQQFKKGEIISNYKELCLIIGEDTKGGTQKKAQLKNLERFIDFEKIEGTKQYLIKEIYKYPKPKESRE